MHIFLSFLAQTTSPTTAAKKSSSSSSYVPIIILVAIFGAVYILFLRPRQQRMRQQQSAARQLAVGDEVMSAGGILGRVVALDADEVEVEVSPGVVMTFTRRAVNPRTPRTGSGPTAAQPVDEPWPVSDRPGDGFGSPGAGEGGPGTNGGPAGGDGEDLPPSSGSAGA
jgi:preprotein translocase subunit YajC